MICAALPGPRSADSAINRVSPSLQPAGLDSIGGGPPDPPGPAPSSITRSNCTPGGKSAGVSNTFSRVAPGQVGDPATTVEQPDTVVTATSPTKAATHRWRRIICPGYRGTSTSAVLM